MADLFRDATKKADCISREAAIEAYCMNCQYIDQEEDKSVCWCMGKDRLNGVPAADVIPVEWIEAQVDKGKWAELIQRWRER